MSELLKIIGLLCFIGGIITGIITGNADDPFAKAIGVKYESFHWAPAIVWWISGLISGIVFFALGRILYTVDYNQHLLEQVLKRIPKEASAQQKPMGTSKGSLDSLKDFKMGSTE